MPAKARQLGHLLNSPCLVWPRFTQFKMLSFFTLFFSSIFSRQQLQIQPDPSSGVDVAMCRELYRDHFLSHDHNIRTEFLSRLCKTTAYPSSGGIVLGYFSAVELAYLNLSRTKPANRSSDPAKERPSRTPHAASWRALVAQLESLRHPQKMDHRRHSLRFPLPA